MSTCALRLTLLSDTTFGRGDGLAGLIDQEVEHDAAGLPYLRGRTLKGLLSEECDNLVAVMPAGTTNWHAVLQRLFGRAGSTDDTAAHWKIGDALLPADLRAAVATQISGNQTDLVPRQVLDSLTAMRRQTAIDPERGTPVRTSLRASRVIVRGLSFVAELTALDAQPAAADLALLAAGCLALRHAGLGRNRGRGALRCTLHDASRTDITERYFQQFVELCR